MSTNPVQYLLAASSTIQSTGDILTALESKLGAIEWKSPDGKCVPAFQQIARFDMRDLIKALKELVAQGDRICLVIYVGEQFSQVRDGRNLRIRQVCHVTLLLADTNLGDRQKAFWGDDVNPGVMALKDLLMGYNAKNQPNLMGLLMNNVYVQPASGEPMAISSKDRDELAGRGAWMMQLELIGGELACDLGGLPIV